MTQNLRPTECDERNALVLNLTKPPDPGAQSEGTTPPELELQAQVVKLANMVLHLEDLLQRQAQEMEELRRQLSTRNEGSQPPRKRRNSQPPQKRSRTKERSNSMESGEILSSNAPAHMSEDMMEDEPLSTEVSDDNRLVTVGMLRQIIKEALQPQHQDCTQKHPTDKDQTKTYAKIAATPFVGKPKAAYSKARAEHLAARAIALPSEPIEFTRIHFRPHRSLKACRSGAETRAVITNMLEKLEIYNRKPYKRSQVFEWSKIGNSLIEIYVPTAEAETVHNTLQKHGLTVYRDLDLLATPENGNSEVDVNEITCRRLGNLLHRNRLRNLKLCILQGLPEATKTRIKAYSQEAEKNNQAAPPP